MQQSCVNNLYPNQNYAVPQNGANAVSINIYTPQAFSPSNNSSSNYNQSSYYTQSAYPAYSSVYDYNSGYNHIPYPPNYNNGFIPNNYAGMPIYNAYPNNLNGYNNGLDSNGYPNGLNGYNNGLGNNTYPNGIYGYNNGLNNGNANNLNGINAENQAQKNNTTETNITNIKTEEKKETKSKETKTITPLTDEYIMSLENYMNNENSKIRLIAIKDVLERFKEDESRKNNASLTPLLNKALQDSSPTIRFLALTGLQLGYCNGDNETIELLKEIQSSKSDITGEDALLASEILLKMSAGEAKKVVK